MSQDKMPLDKMSPGQNVTGKNVSGQNATGQNVTGQNVSGQNVTGRCYEMLQERMSCWKNVIVQEQLSLNHILFTFTRPTSVPHPVLNCDIIIQINSQVLSCDITI